MPSPQIAKPANPAPVVRISSKCDTGTHLVLADPWMSTNWARMNRTSFCFRNFFASASVMNTSLDS